MNIILQSRDTSVPVSVARLIDERLHALASHWRIEEAIVSVTDRPEASPRYVVAIYLRVPGPDMRVTGCDHTVGVAAGKALTSLERRLLARARRRELRRRSNLQHSSAGRTGRAW